MCICTRAVYLCDANTTIKMVNIHITPKSFLLPMYNPSLLLLTLPSTSRSPLICFLSLYATLHFIKFYISGVN